MAHCGAKFQNLGGGQGNDDRGEERRVFGRGRGRGRWLNRRVNGSDEADEFQQRVVGTYDSKIYNAVMRGDTEAVKEALLKDVGQGGEVPSYFKHYESMMSGTDSVSEDAPKKVDVKSTPPARTAPKKAATKTNGYCLFIKHMGRKTNTTGSINELMAMFDKDWKVCDAYYFGVLNSIILACLRIYAIAMTKSIKLIMVPRVYKRKRKGCGRNVPNLVGNLIFVRMTMEKVMDVGVTGHHPLPKWLLRSKPINQRKIMILARKMMTIIKSSLFWLDDDFVCICQFNE